MTFTGQLRPFQVEAFDRMVERKRVLVGYEMGLGKATHVRTPVLTPEGWVPIGRLGVGDRVIGSDGRPTAVLGVFPQGVRPLYRVTFSDGAWVDCDDEHLWAVNTPLRRWRGNPPVVKTTREIRERLVDGAGNRQHFIPMVAPVEFPEGDLPLEPYLLGALLGDGSFSQKHRVRFSTADTEILDILTPLLPEGCRFEHGGRYDYTIKAHGKGKTNPVNAVIREFGFVGHRSEDKRVPEPYIYGASVRQREALLQGLLDTDGHVRPGDNNVEFCTVSDRLATDVQRLVQSLGGTAPIRRKETGFLPAYRMSIALPEEILPFRLSRKAEVYRGRQKYPPSRSIVSVEPVGEDEAVCIKVDAADELFVVKDFVVTHNTVLSIATIEHLLDEGLVSQGLVVVPSSLKYQWLRQIDAFTDEGMALVVDGTPTQRREQYAEIRDGGVEYAILNYEQVVNDWDEVRRLPRDFVVLDEATAIKNFAAKRTKRIKKLGSKYRYALSGQPIENKPEEVFSIMQWVDEDVLGRFDKFDKTFIVRNHFGGVKYYRALPLLHETLGEAMVRKTRQDPDVRDQMPDVTEEIVEIDFDRAGASLYRTIASDLQKEMAAAIGTFGKGFDLAAHYSGEASAEELQQRGKIMSRLTCLRMLCDHPDLLTVSATKYGASQAGEGMAGGSAYAQELLAAGLLDKPMKSPKMKATVDLVEELLEANPRNKVVLFAFFKDVLTMLQDATAGMAKSVLFTGDMSPKEKDTAKQTFQDDPECRLFLSSDAGGYGVDLPNANYLISYDLPWSAGKMDQRNARIIRLSSEFDKVTLIYMLMHGSIEEWQYEKVVQKQAIGAAIMDGKGFDKKTGRLELNLKGLSEFLATSEV